MATIEHDTSQGGFSLIELMVALAITGVVLTGIYGAYHDQLRTSVTQQRIVDMNQNVRTAMLVIERDLRMAGANPSGDAETGIDTATATTLVIAKDDGGSDNQVGNNSNAIGDGLDNDGDGNIDEDDEWYDGDTTDQEEWVQFELDNGNIRRRFNSAASTDPTDNTRLIASNIDALNFVYLDGNDPPNVIPTPVADAELENIRSVQVTIVARSGDTVPVLARKVTDNTVYHNPQGDEVLPAPADQFRRRMVTTTIKCRNMGL